jgi:hypothetical protein
VITPSLTPVLYDHVGAPITVGCRLAYPRRTGSDMWLEVITVAGIRYLKDRVIINGQTINGKRRYTKNLHNCVVIPSEEYWTVK